MLGKTHCLLRLVALLRFCSAKFRPADVVEVHYGEYLLASWVLEHSPWNAYHSGVGFLNNNTGEKILVDYSPTDTSSVGNMIAPHAKMKFNKFWTWLTGDLTLEWRNGGGTRQVDHWPKEYTKFTYLGVINGSVYNKYLKWLKKEFIPTHVTFEPVEVVLPHKGGGVGVPSRMCHDLVSESLWVLYHMGAVYAPKDDIFRDHIIYYAESFEEVDYDQLHVKREVLRYFRVFEQNIMKIKKQFTYVREMLIQAYTMGISPFVYRDEKYIRVHMVAPFLNYCYLPLAIPPKHMDILNDPKLCALPMYANTTNQTKTADAHLIAAEARLDHPRIHVCFLLTAVLVFVGSFRRVEKDSSTSPTQNKKEEKKQQKKKAK